MNVSVSSTTAVEIPFAADRTVLVQNLGPGDLYIDADSEVATTTGIKIASGANLMFPADMNAAGGMFFMISSGTSDVRLMAVD